MEEILILLNKLYAINSHNGYLRNIILSGHRFPRSGRNDIAQCDAFDPSSFQTFYLLGEVPLCRAKMELSN